MSQQQGAKMNPAAAKPAKLSKKAARLEAIILQYAELLLGPSYARTARAEHLTDYSERGEPRLYRGVFYWSNGGFYIEEWDVYSEQLHFTHFMKPWSAESDEELPAGAKVPKWETGLLRHKWMRFSIYDTDHLAPIVSVLKMYFGEIPSGPS